MNNKMEEINTENIDVIFKESPKTFMEILKAHNREVQVANALAFFFRPREKHGLKKLFIDALLNTNCTELSTFIPKKEGSLVKRNGYYCNKPSEDLEYNVDKVNVIVEDPTNNKNRIDILIETDSFTICIEFKINHDLDNPLKDYRDFIAEKTDSKRIYFIVLTPYKKDPIGKAKEFFDENSEFKQVVLSHFFKEIDKRLQLQDTNNFKTNQYYQYFQDFAQTVKNREIRSKRHKALIDLKERINNDKCELHPKGFLEIKKKDYDLKIRIISESITLKIAPGWRIEKWTKNKGKEELKKLNCEVTFDEIIEEIKRH